LPVTKSVEREMRTADRRQVRNKAVDTLTKTEVKKVNKAMSSGDIETAKGNLAAAISVLDKAVEKKIIHKNNAARKKSRIMKKFNALKATAKPENK